MKRFHLLIIILMLLGHLGISICFAGDWKQDFASLCGNSGDAEKMTSEELSRVIGECERVRKEIEGSTDSGKKVALFRLKKSCNFYRFIKESRN